LHELLTFIMPNSGQEKMALLVQNLNPYAVIRTRSKVEAIFTLLCGRWAHALAAMKWEY
jgi:hypothetical protein